MTFQKLGNSLRTSFVLFNLAKRALCVSNGNFNYNFKKDYIDHLSSNGDLAFSSLFIC